jgi:ribosomal protein S12 methylthiotransferase accessory factor
MELTQLLNKEAGLISGEFHKIANRNFMPPNLVAGAISGANLHLLSETRYNNEIVGSSIAFTYEQCLKASIGEFVERYCANFYNKSNCITGSFDGLSGSYNLMNPDDIKIFADWQYQQHDFPFKKPTKQDEIHWIKANDFINDKAIYVPAFLVYMQSLAGNRFYCPHTSTGLAAGQNAEKAIIGGLLEAGERHAFTSFWYHQEYEKYIKYTPQMVINAYGDDPEIVQLYDNNRMKIVIYDLQKYTPFETIMILMYFNHKGVSHQAIGCACRFTKKDALKKAMLEVYQGVEFCIYKKSIPWTLNSPDEVEKLDNFDKCAIYYNHYPEMRLKSPLLKDALTIHDNYAPNIVHKTDGVKTLNRQELLAHGVDKLYTVRLTTPDVAEIGYEVYRVITPDFSLLSGIYKWPFLGNHHFDKNPDRLFYKIPHPFP